MIGTPPNGRLDQRRGPTSPGSPGDPPDPAGPPRPAPQPPAANPALPRRERAGLRALGIPVRAMVVAELLAAAGLLVAAKRTSVAVVVGVAAVAGLVLLLRRPGGRSLTEAAMVRLRLRARRRRRPIGPDDDAGLALLRELVPRLTVTAVPLRSGQPLGVCSDGDGWSAVVAIRQDDPVVTQADPLRVPFDALRLAMDVDDVRLSSVQLLVHSVPAPDRRLPDDCAATASYRLLPGRSAAAERTVLVALRLDAVTAQHAVAARGGGPEGARKALRRNVTRLVALLDAAGVPARPLGDEAVRTALAFVAGTAPAAAPAPGAAAVRRTVESRHGLHCDGLEHVTWWVRAWPDVAAPVQSLVDLAAATPAVSSDVSVTLRPGPGGTVRCTALVRTTDLSPDAAAATAAAIADQASRSGVVLRRLDGEHGPGLAATLPLGGGPAGTMPRTGAHVIGAAAMPRLDLPIGPGGLLAGFDDTAEPVALQLFRPGPTQVALVTSGYVARLLALRAQACGATVEVATSRPDGWLPVLAAVPPQRTMLVPPGAPLPAHADPATPLLRCDDTGADGAARRATVGAWQARFVVQDFTPAAAVPALLGYDLVVLQRVQPDLVAALRTSFGLPEWLLDWLPRLPDDVVALVSADHGRLVRLGSTAVETQLLGPPVRHDG